MKFNDVALRLLIVLSLSTSVLCFTFFYGENKHSGSLLHRASIKYEAIPLKKRVKTYSYNGSMPIKLIVCYDFQNSEASVNITDGGIGYKFVDLRFKSQRSYRLDYSVEIYA